MEEEPTAEQLRFVLDRAAATARGLGAGAAVDDVAQMAAVRLYRRWSSPRVQEAAAENGAHWRNLISVTARRIYFDMIRSESRRTERQMKATGSEGRPRPEIVLAGATIGDGDAELYLAHVTLLDAIDQLEAPLDRVAELAFVEEWNSVEIADELGLDQRTVRRHRERARTRLRRFLDD